jgi:2-(1,2-epoxy-1,2-dihydrophenyl)acetyl-CoA isomerase
MRQILYTKENRIATITLNRPEKLNAYSEVMVHEILAALADARDDEAVRAVIITGAGRGFCSGGDVSRDFQYPSRYRGHRLESMLEMRENMDQLVTFLQRFDKPVIAAVNGPAVGIGCSLALAADLVVAARSAYFLLAFVNIGLGLDGGASQSLTARVGHARAMEMAMLGERIGAEQALDWGMANRVVDDEQLRLTVAELAQRLAAGPPGSYATIKRTINVCTYAGFAENLDLEAQLQQERADSKDFMEGVVSFIQKRPANFTGE